jgi:hypothetical protein
MSNFSVNQDGSIKNMVVNFYRKGTAQQPLQVDVDDYQKLTSLNSDLSIKTQVQVIIGV